jgi:hypothetical protein
MQPPVKIIHKYKNINKNIIYRLYIFIGSNLPKNALEILKKIQNLSLKDANSKLSKEENNIMTNHYNNKDWIKYFYVTKKIQKGGSGEEEIDLDNEEKDNNEINEDDDAFYQLYNDAINKSLNTKDIIGTQDKINKTLKMEGKGLSIFYENEYNEETNISYDMTIEEIYKKSYITNTFIYYDDSINTVKQKICISIPTIKDYVLVPEVQYIFTFNNSIGHKWSGPVPINITPAENILVYEKLKGNNQTIKNLLNNYIKREDTSAYILESYLVDDMLPDIYLIDLYNELGYKYAGSIEESKNLYNTFVRMYFVNITFDHFNKILDGLTKGFAQESLYCSLQYNNILNEVRMETEIDNTIYDASLENYDKYFGKTFKIIHAVIMLYLTCLLYTSPSPRDV